MPLPELITDRTAEDYARALELSAIRWQDMTPEQQAEWQTSLKGAYNASDLNRVTEAVEYLVERLRSFGYAVEYVPVEILHKTSPASRLPDGYTELEYIESTGTQYIDTGFEPKSTTRVVLDVDLVAASGYLGVLGARDTASFIVWQTATGLRFDYGSDNSGVSIANGGRMTIDANQNVLYVNGQPIITADVSTFAISGSTLALFAVVDGPGDVDSRKASGKLYPTDVYDNGTQVRKYLPVKRDSDGAVGVYDLINDQFSGNAGTGVFTAGPDATPDPAPTLDTYTWYEADIPTASQLAQYLANVKAVRDAIENQAPEPPADMVGLTYEEANAIEQILVDIETTIDQVVRSMARSNAFTFWSGNRPFPSAESYLGRTWAELDAMNTTWANWQVATWYLLLYGNLQAEGEVT